MMLTNVLLPYDTEKFGFYGLVRDHLGFEPSKLHEHYSFDRLRRGTEQHTEAHKRLYAIDDSFRVLYRQFVGEVIRPFLGESIVFQAIPNFRVQLPDNVSVRGFHRDRDDAHPVTEINFWVPLTPVEESNAVWMETAEGAEDYRPLLAQPGQVLVFDGANLSHGNQVSSADLTRVSFDFRVILKRLFVPSEDRSMYKGIKFDVGEYYEELS